MSLAGHRVGEGPGGLAHPPGDGEQDPALDIAAQLPEGRHDPAGGAIALGAAPLHRGGPAWGGRRGVVRPGGFNRGIDGLRA